MKTLDEVIETAPYVGTEWTNDALHYLKEYQTIKQKTGKWIFIDSNTVNGKCSECGYESYLYENDVYGEPYCPNCGAKLELK